MIPFPKISFNNKATGVINEAAIGANKGAGIHLLVSLFCVLINAPEFHVDSIIPIMLSISSFEMNKVNPFPGFMAPHSLFIFQTYLLTMRLL